MKPRIKLHPDERILFEGMPQSGFAIYLALNKGFNLIVLIIVLNLVLQKTYLPFDIPLTSINMIIVALMVGMFLWCKNIASRHYYVFTNQRCILYYGFFTISRKSIPYKRISDVNIRRTFVQRILNIAMVYISEQGVGVSFGQGAPGLNVIAGLSHEDAEKVTNIVSERIATSS